MIGRNVYWIGRVKFADRVPMLESERNKAKDWLKQWTPKNSFDAILCAEVNYAIRQLRKEFAAICASVGYDPRAFDMDIYSVEVEVEGSHYRFSPNLEAHGRLSESDVPCAEI